jgi:hypothetical protein
MKYYVKETKQGEDLARTAGYKARDDFEAFCERFGIKRLLVTTSVEDRKNLNVFNKLKCHFIIKKNWEDALSSLNKGDDLFIQFPIVEHSLLLAGVFKKAQKKGVKINLLIHDIELFRAMKRENADRKKRFRIQREETDILKIAHKVIVHNSHMRETLKELIDIDDDHMVDLEIFDYLVDDFHYDEVRKHLRKDQPIIIAANLIKEKAGYVYDLPDNQSFNLYGINYTGNETDLIRYHGSFEPEALPYAVKGSFGLVWDGLTSKTCTGVFGDYLKINNPHKTSFYLSSGIPVVIWKQAALADFVLKHHCGIVVDDVKDIHDTLSSLSDEEYQSMLDSTKMLSQKLREGYFTKKAIEACL